MNQKMSLKNLQKAYDYSLSNSPRTLEFKQLLNLGIWEAKVALNKLLMEKSYDNLTAAERSILQSLSLDSNQLGIKS
jgi:hypothetical protein